MALGNRLAVDDGISTPTTRAVLEGSGAVGSVNSAPDGNDEITVTIDDFDNGTYAFGPVPYVLGAPGTAAPDIGDRAFLHVDSQGEPAYAVVWT